MNRIKPPLLWPIIDQERRDIEDRIRNVVAVLLSAPGAFLIP